MPTAIINDTHLTFSADTKVITQDMVRPYQNTVTHITIPEGVEVINEKAFWHFEKLIAVDLPDSLTTIEDFTFAGCTGLTSVTFPNNLTTIGDSVFLRCTGLTSVTFPNNLTTTGHGVFLRCTGLTHLIFPDSLATIGIQTFYGCTGLTNLTFPASLNTIGRWAFAGCTRLTHLTFPEGFTQIGDGAFEFCTGLTSVTFPDSLTNIANYAFEGCTNLKCLIVPPSFADKGAPYWRGRGIDINKTAIVTQQKLHDFQKSHGIEKNTSTREIKTLYLAQHGFIPLPESRADLSAKTFHPITQLTFQNLLKLPINIRLMLPTSAKYQDITDRLVIFEKAVAPLNELAANARQNLAQWLTWQDIVPILLTKSIRPDAVSTAQIPQQQELSASACQQNDTGTPAQPTQLPHSFVTEVIRGSQNNLPTP
jgi:hypothetical protein